MIYSDRLYFYSLFFVIMLIVVYFAQRNDLKWILVAYDFSLVTSYTFLCNYLPLKDTFFPLIQPIQLKSYILQVLEDSSVNKLPAMPV